MWNAAAGNNTRLHFGVRRLATGLRLARRPHDAAAAFGRSDECEVEPARGLRFAAQPDARTRTVQPRIGGALVNATRARRRR
jgi:hypothetical protein